MSKTPTRLPTTTMYHLLQSAFSSAIHATCSFQVGWKGLELIGIIGYVEVGYIGKVDAVYGGREVVLEDGEAVPW